MQFFFKIELQKLKLNARDPLSCSTSNKVNLRTINGTLAITARKEKYFDSGFTTATIISKDTFKLHSKSERLLFRIRASLPLIDGLIPRVYLISSPTKEFSTIESSINIINYNSLIDQANITKNTDLNEFQDYEMIFDKDNFIWLFNDLQMAEKSSNEKSNKEIKPYPDINDFKFSPNSDLDHYLVITVNVIKEKFDQAPNSEELSCNSLLNLV